MGGALSCTAPLKSGNDSQVGQTKSQRTRIKRESELQDPSDYEKECERWANHIKSMLYLLSFLTLPEVAQLGLTNLEWNRLANRYFRNYSPPFDEPTVKWINAQVKKNSIFFENALATGVCKMVVERSRGEPEMSFQDQIQEVSARIRHHQGHYAAYPPMAIELCSSLGQQDAVSRTHELVFLCKYSQRKLVVSNPSFILATYNAVQGVFNKMETKLMGAETELDVRVEKSLQNFATTVIGNSAAKDGRTLTTKGIFYSEILLHFQEYETILQKQVAMSKKKIKEHTNEYIDKDDVCDSLERYKYGNRDQDILERNEEEASQNELAKHFRCEFDTFIRGLVNAYLEQRSKEMVQQEYFTQHLFDIIDKRIEKTKSGDRITQSYDELIGLPLPDALEIDDSALTSDSDTKYLLNHYPMITDHEALNHVRNEIHSYLDRFLDDQCVHGESKEPDIVEEKVPTTAAQLVAKTPGWLSKYLVDVYFQVETSMPREARTYSDKLCEVISNYSLRCYVNHIVMKQHALRALSPSPKGPLSVSADLRNAHYLNLTQALQTSILRDFGPDLAKMLSPDSKEFETRIRHDTEYLLAVSAMAFNKLASYIQAKRKQIADFELNRRKSDTMD